MSTSKDSVAVRIAGHEYKIRSDGDDDALREIASYVDRAMTRVRERTGTVDTLDVAVLTSLNLAREILALHEERADLPGVVDGASSIEDDRLKDLIERVESSLVPPRADAADPSASPGPPQGATSTSAKDADVSREASPSEEDSATGAAPARTLDLPSVEALRERAASRGSDGRVEDDLHAGLPEQRVAAGGRDRAS